MDGQVSLTGSQALRLNVEKLPIEGLRAFFSEAPDVTGILSAQVQLEGTAAAPQVVAALSLENSKIAGHSYAGLVASGSYRDQKAEVKATVQQDQGHTANATATLPMTVSWNNGWRAEAAGNIDSRIQSSGLSLAFLNAFSGKAIQGIAGEVEVDLQVRGSLNQPVASGVLRVRDGKLTPTALGVQVSSITAEGLLEPRGVRISQISARANKGELNGSGFIALQKFVPQGLTLPLPRSNGRRSTRNNIRLKSTAPLKLTAHWPLRGSPASSKFQEASCVPDLSFLDRGNTPVKRDPTITVVSTTAARQRRSQAGEQRSSRQ